MAELLAVPQHHLVAESLADLRADFDELAFVARDRVSCLDELTGALAREGDIRRETAEPLLRQVRSTRRLYCDLLERLDGLRGATAYGSPELVDVLAAEKASLADTLRAQQAVVAGLITAPDWQSPSFAHSTLPAAGRHAGRVIPHWNDYRRDRHLDADAYERAYVQGAGSGDVRALMTGCGMAAFTTILNFLLMERLLEGPVVAGRALYHETKKLLLRALPGSVYEVDEGDADALGRAVRGLRPAAVFLDSLCNTRWAPVPDLTPVFRAIRRTNAFLVLDNTGLSMSFEPFRMAAGVRLVVWESLLKYAQLGLDRANAGVILAHPEDAERLSEYREHLGTNIADVSVNALPRPDQAILGRRLARLERNAGVIARALQREADGAVVYPGLPSHRSHTVARRLAFRGGCVGVVTDEALGERLVGVAIAEARRAGVPLVGGTSFGLDTTRVYLVHGAEPFVRIAAGTEHRALAAEVAGALARAVRRVLE